MQLVKGSAEDLPSGLAANFRAFGFGERICNESIQRMGLKRRVRASARRSRADLYQDKHTSYNQMANLLLRIRAILKRYLPFGFECFSGRYSFGFELFSLLSFGFFPVYCLY